MEETASANRAFESTRVSVLWKPGWKGPSPPNTTIFAPNNAAIDKFISKIKVDIGLLSYSNTN